MIEKYRYRCPECRSASLTPTRYGEGDYRCQKCDETMSRQERVDTRLPPAETIEGEGWDVSDAELIGLVRSRHD